MGRDDKRAVAAGNLGRHDVLGSKHRAHRAGQCQLLGQSAALGNYPQSDIEWQHARHASGSVFAEAMAQHSRRLDSP
jgi:hypothetical protein